MGKQKTLKAWDAINGASGTCYAVIDGEQHDMIYLKKISAKVTKSKSEIKVLGSTATKHKANGWSGTGTAEMYYVTSMFRKMMVEYIKTGKDLYFDLHIINEDPSSEIGKQHIWLKQVNIDEISVGELDINSTELSEEINFTFNDVDIMNKFDEPIGE